ncbi:MAG: hypothetical protein COB37_09665 [Kordiimonadales bacterium]|nr:MAG: hypothetical protein COB37_09665 [Kordiimonadales bacterium]
MGMREFTRKLRSIKSQKMAQTCSNWAGDSFSLGARCLRAPCLSSFVNGWLVCQKSIATF